MVCWFVALRYVRGLLVILVLPLVVARGVLVTWPCVCGEVGQRADDDSLRPGGSSFFSL